MPSSDKIKFIMRERKTTYGVAFFLHIDIGGHAVMEKEGPDVVNGEMEAFKEWLVKQSLESLAEQFPVSINWAGKTEFAKEAQAGMTFLDFIKAGVKNEN